jgi:hypothetical protein
MIILIMGGGGEDKRSGIDDEEREVYQGRHGCGYVGYLESVRGE